MMAEKDHRDTEPNRRAKLRSYIGACEFATVYQRNVAKLRSCRVAELQSCRVAELQSCEVAKLRGCEVARLRSCEVAKLRSCEVAKLQLCVGKPWQTHIILCNCATSPCDLALYNSCPRP